MKCLPFGGNFKIDGMGSDHFSSCYCTLLAIYNDYTKITKNYLQDLVMPTR